MLKHKYFSLTTPFEFGRLELEVTFFLARKLQAIPLTSEFHLWQVMVTPCLVAFPVAMIKYPKTSNRAGTGAASAVTALAALADNLHGCSQHL